MKITGNVELGSWLAPRFTAARAGTPAGIVGVGFEAYLRILHPVPVSYNEASPTGPSGEEGEPVESWWSWAEVARRNNRSMHPLVQWSKVSNGDSQEALSFRDGWSIDRPPDYYLEPDLLSGLVAHFGESTASPDSIVGAVWNGFGTLNNPEAMSAHDADSDETWVNTQNPDCSDDTVHLVSRQVAKAVNSGPFLELPGREYVLFHTSLTELTDCRWVDSAGLGWGSGFPQVLPQLFWPTSHEWVIGNDVDLDFTIVGGTKELIRSVHSDARLESFIVEAGDNLTRWGDVFNS